MLSYWGILLSKFLSSRIMPTSIGKFHTHMYFVSFYLIRMNGEKSLVRLCECQNTNSPSDTMNVNTIKNSYAALW